MLNIVFMGTPDFAKESLEMLYNEGYNILGVFTAPDKPKGRGLNLIPSPVKEYSQEKKFAIYQPEKLRNNTEMIEKIKELNPDVICVVAYGIILPKEILDIASLGCVNVHGSLLPKYRGSSPIQYAIINGDKTTGITTMYMDEGMDTGDIILKEEVEIFDDETTGELWNRLSSVGAKLLVETLEQIEKGTAPRIEQGKDFTLAPMLDKEMSKIDWEEKTAKEISDLTRGLNPIMGTYSFLNGKKIKFWKLQVVTVKEFLEKYKEFEGYEYRFDSIDSGTILYIDMKEGIYVKAKDEIIKILEIQAENSKQMNILDFLRGNKIEVVDRFE